MSFLTYINHNMTIIYSVHNYINKFLKKDIIKVTKFCFFDVFFMFLASFFNCLCERNLKAGNNNK